MKKVFYLLSVFCTVSLGSCNQELTDSKNQNDSLDNEKQRYLLEETYWYTYVDENLTNLIVDKEYKYAYERDSDAKYIKSKSDYYDHELTRKVIFQNLSDRDYSYQVYPTGNETTSADTTIWYDEARSIQKEFRSKTYFSIYEYDKQHNDRRTSYKQYYRSNDNTYLSLKTDYTYSNLTEYSESTFYDSEGNITSTTEGISEYLDDTYKRCARFEETIYQNQRINYIFRGTIEWDGKNVIKRETSYEFFDQAGQIFQTSKYITKYVWTDELNNNYYMEYYTNDVLQDRTEGYSKYTY